MKSNTAYDIQIMRSGRWSTESRIDDEEEAKALALKYVSSPKCEGARVLKCWLRSDGTEMETEIFSKTQQVKEDNEARIDHIDTVPDRCECEHLMDYFSLRSRLLMSRLFHSYLDKITLTPTEVLHSARDLKRLQDKNLLLPSAIDRIATLQSNKSGQNAKARRDELFKIVDEMTAKARKTEAIVLPKITDSLADMVKSLPPVADEWERDYLICTALSRDLQDVNSFTGKLERLCKLASGCDAAFAGLLDDFIAELLETSAVQDILGRQAGLGHAIASMIDLANGVMATEKSDASETADLLNRLFAARRLPSSSANLIDRAHRLIASSIPLYRSDDKQEYDNFKKLVYKILSPKGLLCGPTTAQALTGRYLRMIKECSRNDAVSAVFRAMPDRAYGIIYLCDLAHGEFVTESINKLTAAYPVAIKGQHITNLVQSRLSPKDRMTRATAAFHAVMAAPFPQDVKQPVIELIDRLLDEYLVEERIVEKLDHPDASLRDRAVRLVQFCASGVLPEGVALSRARQRVRAMLRQPNFDAQFIEGISDPVQAQKSLRDFHILLVSKAGFGG